MGSFINAPKLQNHTLIEAITLAGLTSGLKLCLDAGNTDSWATPVSTQIWKDTSGNSTDFYVGIDGTSTTTDPTYVGIPGNKSANEYFGMDGGDYFNLVSAQPAWVDSMHMAGAKFSAVAVARLTNTGTSRHLFGDGANTTGMTLRVSTANKLNFLVQNAGVTVLSAVTTADVPYNQVYCMYGIAIDESVGANGCLLYANGVTETVTSTYTLPSALTATSVLQLASRGSGGVNLPSGSRLAMTAMWDGVALTQANFDTLFADIRIRYGV